MYVKKISVCCAMSQIPAPSFAVLQWKLAQRENHTAEWNIRALYKLELICPSELLHTTLPSKSNGMMDFYRTHCNILWPSKEESLMIISISSTWPSSAAWCKGDVLISSYLLNFFRFFMRFLNLHVLPSRTTWKYIKNCYLQQAYVKLINTS